MGEPITVPKDGAIEVKLGDNSVVKGTDPEDAFKNLAEMKVNASKAIKDTHDKWEAEKAERERLAGELETAKAELDKAKEPPKAQPKPDDGKAFNRETYFALLGEDPMKAQDYIDAYRFGIESPDKVRGTFNDMRQNLDRVAQQVDSFTQESVTARFLAQHPEYPQGDLDAAKKLTAQVSELVKQGMPYSPTLVEFAFFQLVNADQIKVLEPEEEKPEPQKEPPPPSLSGISAAEMGELTKAEGMSDKDLLALLQSKGMFK
jgi:hypothetical protein